MRTLIVLALMLTTGLTRAQTCETYNIVTVGGSNTVGFFNTSSFPGQFGTCRAIRSGNACVGLGLEGIGGFQPDMKDLLRNSLTPINIYNYAGSNVTTDDWETIGNQIVQDFQPGELDLVLLMGGTEDIINGVWRQYHCQSLTACCGRGLIERAVCSGWHTAAFI